MHHATRALVRVAAVGGIAAGLALTSSAADARPMHHTAQLRPSGHHVTESWVVDARFVHVRGGKMVRFKMNNGSVYLSPNDDCLGPRHYACLDAWKIARKRQFFGL